MTRTHQEIRQQRSRREEQSRKGKQDIGSVQKTQKGQKYDNIHVNYRRQNQNQKRQGQRQNQNIFTDLTHSNPGCHSFISCAFVLASCQCFPCAYSSNSSRSQSFDLRCANGVLSRRRNPIYRQPRRPLFSVLVCYLDLGLGNMQSVLISPMHQRHTACWENIKHASFCKPCTAQDKTRQAECRREY